jgi:hypothetical protein
MVVRDVEAEVSKELRVAVLETVEPETTEFVPLTPMQSVRESFISAANVS